MRTCRSQRQHGGGVTLASVRLAGIRLAALPTQDNRTEPAFPKGATASFFTAARSDRGQRAAHRAACRAIGALQCARVGFEHGRRLPRMSTLATRPRDPGGRASTSVRPGGTRRRHPAGPHRGDARDRRQRRAAAAVGARRPSSSIPSTTSTVGPTSRTATADGVTGTDEQTSPTVRSRPARARPRSARSHKGDDVVIDGRTTDSNWYRIIFPPHSELHGWIEADALSTSSATLRHSSWRRRSRQSSLRCRLTPPDVLTARRRPALTPTESETPDVTPTVSDDSCPTSSSAPRRRCRTASSSSRS